MVQKVYDYLTVHLNITDSRRVFVIINFFDIMVSENCLICEYIYERINGGYDE